MKTGINRTMWLTALVAAQTFTAATAGTVSQSPLFLTSSAKPNIMLLIDNSHSMKSVAVNYDEDRAGGYPCNNDNVLPNKDGDGNYINVTVVVDSGSPKFNAGSDPSYQWSSTTVNDTSCFAPEESYSASLRTDFTSHTLYSGKFLNWYFGSDDAGATYPATSAGGWGVMKPASSSRMDAAKRAATDLVNSMNNVNLGLAVFNNGVGADIKISVTDVDRARSDITRAINGLVANASTPLAESLHQIGRYFVGIDGAGDPHPGHQAQSCTVNGHWDGELELLRGSAAGPIDHADLFNVTPVFQDGQSTESPICHSCQKNFVIVLSDGLPREDLNIPDALKDYDEDCSGCTADSSVPLTNQGSDYLDDVALALHDLDLRPDVDAPDGSAVTNNLSTYTIGFADDTAINSRLMRDAAAHGGGQFYPATSASDLTDALGMAVSDIHAQLSSATAVTTSSTRLNTSTIAFQALFNSGDWSGSLVALPISGDGTVGSAVWDAADNIPPPIDRKIYSYNSTSASFAAYAFTDSNLSLIQRVASAAGGSLPTADQVNYVRGNQTNESATGFRVRSSLLGDVINSDPLFVGKPTFGYSQLGSDSEGGTYDAYRTGSPYTDRPNLLFIGANDGMLHGFSFDYTNNSADGTELFAYIPSAVVGNLTKLSDRDYSHQYYVDGSVTYSDAYIDMNGMASGVTKGWRTVLVGTTGAGGSGVYALDISEPESFTKDDVLWDISANNATNIFFDVRARALNRDVFDNLGFTIGEASIVRMADGHFYAVFGNGYNSGSGKAVLYIVGLDDADGDGDIEVIALDTETTANGMSSPLVVDADGDRIADTIYAGDLKGNLWKVDVTSANSGQWGFSFTRDSLPAPLFTATDGTNPQPITAKPQARLHPTEDGVLVLFGTGKYFETDDSVIDVSPQIQTFYGVFDRGATVSRGELVRQRILSEGTLETFSVRVTSAEDVTYPTNKGWYMDLVLASDAKGERVVNTPLLRDDRVIFTTVIPSADPCAFGGSSWLMEVNSLSGSRLKASPFDVTEDGYFDSSDYAPLKDAEGNLVVDDAGNTVMVAVSGLSKVSLGLFDNPAVVEDGTKEIKILGGSSGDITTVKESKSTGGGRQSWQQLQ